MERLLNTGEITAEYLRTSEHYLSNAEETIQKKELRKASELLWGAITQKIKAIASICNFKIDRHKDFENFIISISKQLRDKNLFELYSELNILHRNFYDEYISEEIFPFYHAKSYRLLEKLDRIQKEIT